MPCLDDTSEKILKQAFAVFNQRTFKTLPAAIAYPVLRSSLETTQSTGISLWGYYSSIEKLMSAASAKKHLTVDWKTVGRRIRELRGFDTRQAEMAQALGIAQSYLSAIERGLKEPSATILFRIARQYGKSIEWLLIGE